MFFFPLFSLCRQGHEEVRVEGELVVCRGDEILYRTGEAVGAYPARSLLKPFQFLAGGIGPPRGRHVPALGSISATREQVSSLEAWYPDEPSRALFERLVLSPCYPMDEAHRAELLASQRPPSVLYHPCFSKHAAILEACARDHWDQATYTSTEHPFQRRLMETIAALLGERQESQAVVTDGCLLPSPVLTSHELARLYRRLAVAPPRSELGDIAQAMLRAPDWIGGPERLDTRVMRANPGRVIAKEGADGLLAIAVAADDAGEALGIFLKLAAGYVPRFSALALAPLFAALGLQLPAETVNGQTVQYHYRPLIRPRTHYWDLSPSLSERTAVWPGDVAMRRALTSDQWQESGVTVSSIHSTVHLGAHADAPNHVEAGQPGIDSVDLSRYTGPCQVIEVSKPAGAIVLPADLGRVDIRAPRILLKTRSFPDTEHFNEDFVSCSAELISWLSSRGAMLIGIDTPSIDPCHSKALPAHHAAVRAGISILEGLVLDAVTPGLYELIALPLRLEGADASPVRAILRPSCSGAAPDDEPASR